MRHAGVRGRAAGHCFHRFTHRARQRAVPGSVERPAGGSDPHLSLFARPADHLPQFFGDLVRALPGQRAALDGERAFWRVGGQAHPAADEGAVERRGPDQRIGSGAKRLRVEAVEGRDDATHARDGAHAQIEPAPVGGAAARDDVGPDESLVGQDQLPRARLGQNASVRAVPAHEVRRADALVFLVRHQRQQDAPPERADDERRRRRHARGHASLHVERPPAEDSPVLPPRLEGRDRHAGRADCVEMPAQDQGRASAPDLGHDVGASRGGRFLVSGNAVAGQPVARKIGDGRFAMRLIGRDGRIHGGNPDEIREEVEDRFRGERIGGRWAWGDRGASLRLSRSRALHGGQAPAMPPRRKRPRAGAAFRGATSAGAGTACRSKTDGRESRRSGCRPCRRSP